MTPAPLLAVRNLSFTYEPDDAAPLLHGWGATFEAGSLTAITGRSGRGKSTLLYLLGLMLKPSGGRITVDGRSAWQLSDAGRARVRAACFGFVFQDAALDATRSVMDNVTETALYRGANRREAQRDARELLERFAVDVPEMRRPGQVSGGQAQRIALCRALLANPRILLADEPTGNLDPKTSTLIFGALRDHADSGAAVIIVTHSPSLADSCDRVIPL